MQSPGFASAAAGIVHAGQFSFGSPNDGGGYELTAIAAVVIGGTSLFGGSGSMIGTIAGSIMLGALANILQLNDVNAALQLLATGAIIVLAAVLQSLVSRRDAAGTLIETATRGTGMRTTVKALLLGATALAWAMPVVYAASPIVKDCGPKGHYVIGFSQANYAEPYRQHVNNDLIARVKEYPAIQAADLRRRRQRQHADLAGGQFHYPAGGPADDLALRGGAAHTGRRPRDEGRDSGDRARPRDGRHRGQGLHGLRRRRQLQDRL